MGHLASLGWWISSGRYEAKWTLERLKRLVELAGAAEPPKYVMDRLAELSDRHPAETLAVLESWVAAEVPSSDGNGRRTSALVGRTESARRILRAASTNPSSRDRACSLRDRLLAVGHRGFRDIGSAIAVALLCSATVACGDARSRAGDDTRNTVQASDSGGVAYISLGRVEELTAPELTADLVA